MPTTKPTTDTEAAAAQILLFPQALGRRENPGGPDSEDGRRVEGSRPASGRSVVLCGTYRKDPAGLRRTFDNLKDLGFSILSPSNTFVEAEENGFVYMRHESTQTPHQLENNHLDAIQRSDFVWFFAPGGYVGPTGALEVGFARANGIPVYSDTPLDDTVLKGFVMLVDSPLTVCDHFKSHRVPPPPPAVKTFQNYYRRVALERGYSNENAKDCLLLMLEEFGELARALRKRMHLVRHGKQIPNHESSELADVFIYVVHMANILKLDLSKAVQDKELLNIRKLINGK
ncbi:MAG: hypothetical protein HS113_01495 [Verrucomicrobiales bacterium]|nr:hypothetical protein [Verrucomicrobiales bacterium]